MLFLLVAVDEYHSGDDLVQLMGAVEFSPLAFGLAQELKDHGQCRLAAAVAFGLPGAMAHGGESALDGVGRPQGGPVFGQEAEDRRLEQLELVSEMKPQQ